MDDLRLLLYNHLDYHASTPWSNVRIARDHSTPRRRSSSMSTAPVRPPSRSKPSLSTLPCDEAKTARFASEPFRKVLRGDARDLRKVFAGLKHSRISPIEDKSVDLIVTSPPYWRKRDYGIEGQIGQEETAEALVEPILTAIKEWCRVLRPSGSIFLTIGDSYWRTSLAGVPSRVEAGARKSGLAVRNRIFWIKKGGSPEPARDRLASRHEY